MTSSIFAEHYQQYLDKGFEPRRVKPGDKACKDTGWSKLNAELPEGIFDKWANGRMNYGIGLRLGTIFPDGTMLAAKDIDDNRYVRVGGFLLGNPVCGRFGSKGIAYFVRLRGNLGKAKVVFDVKLDDCTKIHVGELLAENSLVVIPPTIHPGTKKPYRWIGKPLLETDFNEFPIIEV